MAVRFNKGMSLESTRKLPPAIRPPEPQKGNTAHGMPGPIKTGQTASEGGAKGGSGSGPKREGSIGKRGSEGAKRLNKAAPGTSTKSYHADSTGHPGRIERMKARTSFEGKRKSSCMY